MACFLVVCLLGYDKPSIVLVEVKNSSSLVLLSDPVPLKPPPPLPRIVGFYHVFEMERGLTYPIVEEQVATLRQLSSDVEVDRVNYLYVGPDPSFEIVESSPPFVKSNQSSASGNEDRTLGILRDHCVENPEDIVFYVHTKGAFHPSSHNDLFRRNLMKAVLYCIKERSLFEESDLCGLRMSPVPYPQLSGNMWAARCAYIRRLVPPDELGIRLGALGEPPGCADCYVGTNRFASELWVVSHPTAVIKDILPLLDDKGNPIRYVWAYEYLPDPHSWTPVLASFPRDGISAEGFFTEGYVQLAMCSTMSLREAQYVAAYGEGVLMGLPGNGLYCAWGGLANMSDGWGGRLAGFLVDLREKSIYPYSCGSVQPTQKNPFSDS